MVGYQSLSAIQTGIVILLDWKHLFDHNDWLPGTCLSPSLEADHAFTCRRLFVAVLLRDS